jgi:hypothetical protein
MALAGNLTPTVHLEPRRYTDRLGKECYLPIITSRSVLITEAYRLKLLAHSKFVIPTKEENCANEHRRTSYAVSFDAEWKVRDAEVMRMSARALTV